MPGYTRNSIRLNVDQVVNQDPGNTDIDVPLFFQGPSSRYTAPNVRVPIILKLSQTSAQMIINGTGIANSHPATRTGLRPYRSDRVPAR